MPIYEFYCEKCNTVYKFLSRTVNTEKIPRCPSCRDVGLKRQMSLFAAVSGRKEEGPGDSMPPIDESRMEKAMMMLAKEAEGINEDDPRQAANLMRKLSSAAGLKMNEGMEEALSRMERGENPEDIEKEMGELFKDEDPFTVEGQGKKVTRKEKPKTDEKLYEL